MSRSLKEGFLLKNTKKRFGKKFFVLLFIVNFIRKNKNNNLE